MDYERWDSSIQEAILSLDDNQAKTRSQKFIKQFPNALTTLRASLSNQTLARPLAEFQKHPTYLLRWLLADWKDEEKKVLRTDLNDIIPRAIKAIQNTQEWRSGKGDNWSKWGFRDMDDLYDNLKTPPELESTLQTWYFQRFCGLDTTGHPVHIELLPNTFREDLILALSIRRVVNNEHTLRHRIPLLNPPPEIARNGVSLPASSSMRPNVLSNPILGATWILDARRLGIWYSGAIYKTATALLEHSQKITSAHYPEQGYRTVVLNLGAVFGTFYNLAMATMPATTQASTRCYIGKDVMKEVMGDWDNVPKLIRDSKQTRLTDFEEVKFRDDQGPFVM